jgi:hypothetical protein
MKLKPKQSEKSELATEEPVSKSSANPTTITVPDVKMVAIARLQDTDDWYTIFQFRRHDGRTAYMAMPSGDANLVKCVTSALRNAGAAGSSHYSFPDLVKKLTTATRPVSVLRYQTGCWSMNLRVPRLLLALCSSALTSMGGSARSSLSGTGALGSRSLILAAAGQRSLGRQRSQSRP